MQTELTLEEIRAEGLLTEAQELELAAWFRASSLKPEPMDLPPELEAALMNALALYQLDPDEETMH